MTNGYALTSVLEDSEIENAVLWNSRRYDAQAQLHYYKYRHYQATTGRWPSRDPISEWGGINLYQMVFNDPTNWCDYLGLEGTGSEEDCCKGRKGVEEFTDDAGEKCCEDEIKGIEVNSDHGRIENTWLNTADGSYGHYPKTPVRRLQGLGEWATGKGTSRKGETQNPDSHQTAYDENGTKPSASKKYNLCPGGYKKFQDSIKRNSNKDYSVPNNPAKNCVGWACGRLKDVGLNPPVDPRKNKAHPNDIK